MSAYVITCIAQLSVTDADDNPIDEQVDLHFVHLCIVTAAMVGRHVYVWSQDALLISTSSDQWFNWPTTDRRPYLRLSEYKDIVINL